jgi:alpha-L-fucosidase
MMNLKTPVLEKLNCQKPGNTIRSWVSILMFILVIITCTTNDLAAQSSQTAERSRWFREARVGMIIHWGLYSIPAGVWNGKQIPWYGEWIKDRASISNADYSKLATQFNPEKFNADEWIQTASDAGMKYFCLVTKHHDGFCLWDTQENNNWNIMDATPFKRDIVKELADACHSKGIVYSLYYSSGLDWHYPSSTWTPYKQYYYKQLKELLTNYGKIGYLWFDGEWTPQWNNQEAINLYNYVQSIDSTILTNNPKQKSSAAYGDFGLDEENYSPPSSDFNTGLWERDRLVQENTWGYKSWEPWKKSEDLIRDMIDAASLSMNFCLNVGPKADGSFPAEALSILKDFGRWLKVNGEGIYGTTGFVKNITVNNESRITTKDNETYYVHCINWKASPLIITTPLDIQNVNPLDTSINITGSTISRANGITTIRVLRPVNFDPVATVFKLEKTCSFPVTGVHVNSPSFLVSINNTVQLIPTVEPINACNKFVTWSSSDTSIATVDENGLVKGIAEGNVNVNVNADNGNTTDTIALSVQIVSAAGVKINPTHAEVVKGGSNNELKAVISPSNATNKAVKWSCSDTLVATIDSIGVISGIEFGIAIITATTIDGSKTDTCIVTVNSGCSATGSILYQRWDNITGLAVKDLTSASNYPDKPSSSMFLSSMEAGTNIAENFGARITGYICAPATGNYTFWISSDDNSELWLSTDTISGNKVKIAQVTGWTNPRDWNVDAAQKSPAIPLIQGHKYYIEALMKEANVGDNLAVGWAKPGQSTNSPGEVVPGSVLSPNLQVVTSVIGVTVSPRSAFMLTGTNKQIKATLNPANATEQKVNWISSNNAVASIDASGKVTANSNGATYILATTEDGHKTDSCQISVGTTGLDLNSASGIDIFPNPFTGSFSVTGLPEGITAVIISNPNGQAVYQCSFEVKGNLVISGLDFLTEGVYFITLKNKTGILNRKILVK